MSMRRVAAALLLMLAIANFAIAANPIEGTWELVAISPVSGDESDPHGIKNHKLHYTADGRLHIIDPDAKLTKTTPEARYSFDGRTRTIMLANGSTQQNAVAVNGNTMTIEVEDGGTMTYRRLIGERACDRELAPISVEVIAMKDGRYPKVTYDERDHSKEPMRDRVRGIWEAIAYGQVPAGDFPPFGFPNDKYVITDKTVAVVPPNATKIDATSMPTGTYTFAGDKLIVDGKDVWKIRFDRWQRLIIQRDDATITLRLITRATSPIPELPVKIALYDDKE